MFFVIQVPWNNRAQQFHVLTLRTHINCMRALLCNCYAPLLAYLTKFLIGDYIFSIQCTTPLNELTAIFLVFLIFLPLIFADIHSFFIGHILLDSSNSNVPNTFSFFFSSLNNFLSFFRFSKYSFGIFQSFNFLY